MSEPAAINCEDVCLEPGIGKMFKVKRYHNLKANNFCHPT